MAQGGQLGRRRGRAEVGRLLSHGLFQPITRVRHRRVVASFYQWFCFLGQVASADVEYLDYQVAE